MAELPYLNSNKVVDVSCNFVGISPVTYHDKDSIVASYCAEKIFNIAVINVICDAAGISRTRFDNTHIA